MMLVNGGKRTMGVLMAPKVSLSLAICESKSTVKGNETESKLVRLFST